MIKGIFFDVGGVLLDGEIEVFFKALSEKLGISYDELMELHKNHKESLMNGKMSIREFAKEFEKTFRLESRYFLIWKETYLKSIPINEEVLKTARKLSRKYTVGIISNAMDDFEKINTQRGLYKGFSPVIISCKCGYHKPQKEIFSLALKESGLNAKECIFIDDREKLQETPKEMGFKTILYKSGKQLTEDLKKEGVEL